MAELLESTINGNLYVAGHVCLNGNADAGVIIRNNGISSGLTINSTLKGYVNIADSITLIGGTKTANTGIGLNKNGMFLWTQAGGLRGFIGSSGTEIFKIDNKGRYYCLGTTSDADYGNYVSGGTNKVKFHISKTTSTGVPGSSSWTDAMKGASLTTSSASLSVSATVSNASWSVSPLGNGLLLITGVFSLSGAGAMKQGTWIRLTLPKSMTIYSMNVSTLDTDSNTQGGNAWFVAKKSFDSPTTYAYVCKNTEFSGTTGFSYTIVAKLTTQSELPGIFS